MRKVITLVGGVVVLVLAVAVSCAALRTPAGLTSPDAAAHAYFSAWGRGDFAAMRRLVAEPPADFAERHRDLSRSLKVTNVAFTPAAPVRDGDRASVDYKVDRSLFGLGTWSFHSALRLVRSHGRWLVRWAPSTLYPALAEGGRLVLAQSDTAPSEPVAADGKALGSGNGAEPYLPELADRFGDDGGDPAWLVELDNPGQEIRPLKLFGDKGGKPVRTTLDRQMQAAADRAVGSASAALVAVRPSTGEVLAVTDRLPQTQGAFLGRYPPGSTFKVITAAALLGQGMTPSTPVDCPAVTVAAERTIHNHGDFSLGRVPFSRAFADSCNTTFATLGVSTGARRLADAASAFGFGSDLEVGVSAYSADFPAPDGGNALAEASIGQGRVQASPLDMALVAAAVADGTYRSPRLVAAHLVDNRVARRLPPAVVAGLRTMMGQVVTGGTAAHAGLPAGTHGKTGTAEYDDAGHTHAWFIGYLGDLAFAVFVQHGSDGGQVAGPIAAHFLAVAKR